MSIAWNRISTTLVVHRDIIRSHLHYPMSYVLHDTSITEIMRGDRAYYSFLSPLLITCIYDEIIQP